MDSKGLGFEEGNCDSNNEESLLKTTKKGQLGLIEVRPILNFRVHYYNKLDFI